MASQYQVRKTSGGYNLFMRDFPSPGNFIKKNKDVVSLAMCERYIFDTMDPGDIVQLEDRFFVVYPPTQA